MLGKAVTRIASTLAAVLFFVAAFATSGHAQATTGKIQGRVTTSTGQPISSAQVSIDGTSLGNITNDEGFYFINEVPAGLHNIRAQSIGYRSQITSQQRVLAGQTHTINFTLEQAAVEIDAIVVTGERNPLVPRDQVSSRSIVTGETIDQLPLDNAASIIVLQPGVITTGDGFSIRGSREGEHGVFIDGVPVRNLRTGSAQTVEMGTNSLAQVDVTTGGIAAKFGNSQSGVINYVTKSGGSTFGGSFSLQTDRLAPESVRGGFTRGEISLGGPMPFVNNLSFFASSTLEGNKYGAQPQGNPYPIFVASGVDTVMRLARSGQTPGATDSVDVIIPNFVEWDNGPTLPTGVADELNLTTRLTYGLGRGSKLDLTYHYNRDQSLARGTAGILNPDAWGGNYASENMLTLGGYFLLFQSSERALALDVKASYQRDWAQFGAVERSWQEGALFPAFGVNFGKMPFVFDPDSYEVSDELLLGLRSGVLPPSLLTLLGSKEIPQIQGVEGVAETLRLNPFAMRTTWSVSGTGNANQGYTTEKRLYLNASADWQMNRFNRFWVGGEITRADSRTLSVPLYNGVNNVNASKFEPSTAGLYVQNRLDIGDVVLEGGLRMDYYDPNGVFPRLPGFVNNLPDSLKGDAYTLRTGDEPWQQRLQRVEDCGGAATAAFRMNPTTGQAVCKNNFISAKTRTSFNPKLAVSFPVTSTSTFRLSYSQNVQPVGLTQLLSAALVDLAVTNTNAEYGRDIELPKTVLFEAGYRQVFGGSTVIDAAVYSKTTRNAVTYRKVQYTNPVTRSPTFLNVLTNADYSLARGVDLKVDRRLGNLADLSVNYSFVDARGTGSDPLTFTRIVFRRNTNLSVLTGQPVDPPEILLALDQSRSHNLSGTLSVSLGDDYMEDSRVANAILGDVGVFATARLASGLPYTRLENAGDGWIGPPTPNLSGGEPIEQLNSSRGPGMAQFDVRVTKGFEVFGKGARVFADMRNPFNLATTNQIFIETGRDVNDEWYEQSIQQTLNTQFGAGGNPQTMVISQWPENAVNQYMLAQAEARFGNGDGIFTLEEQTTAWGTYFNYSTNGAPWRLRQTNQSLRLGFELVF